MATRGAKFSEQIAAFAKKVEARGAAFLRAYSGQVTGQLVALSPVGDPSLWKNPPAPGYKGGYFKGNWQLRVGSPAVGEVSRIDPTGTETLAAAASAVAGVRMGQRVSITNNVPYARRLEYGWSRQAPAGMVRVTLAQSATLAREAAKQARAEVP